MENNFSLSEKAKKAAEGLEFFCMDPTQAKLYLRLKSINKDFAKITDIKAYLLIDKSIDANRLAEAVETTIKSHPIYSASIVEQGGKPMLTNAGKFLPVEVLEMQESDMPKYIEQYFSTPRDADKALYKFAMIKTPAQIYMLTRINHAITDLSSLYVFASELSMRYEGKDVAPEVLNWYQYSAFLDEYVKSQEMSLLLEDFGKLVSDFPSLSKADVHSPEKFVFQLATKKELNQLRQLSRKLGVAFINCIVAAFTLGLMRLQDKKHLGVAMTYHGRFDESLAMMHGCMAHKRPLLSRIPESGSVADFLTEFNSMQELIMDKYQLASDVIFEKYASVMDSGISFNIQIPERPVNISGVPIKICRPSVKVMASVPLHAYLNVNPDGWELDMTSNRWNHEELQQLGETIRQILLNMADKKFINEL